MSYWQELLEWQNISCGSCDYHLENPLMRQLKCSYKGELERVIRGVGFIYTGEGTVKGLYRSLEDEMRSDEDSLQGPRGLSGSEMTSLNKTVICTIYKKISERLNQGIISKRSSQKIISNIISRIIIDKYYDKLIDLQLEYEVRIREFYNPVWGTYSTDKLHVDMNEKGELRFTGLSGGKEKKEVILKKIRNLYILMGRPNE
jgi:hypothetical protein